MSDGTGIEWCDSTWNVVIGCDKVSPGCTNCYAIRTAHRMQANPNPKVREPYAGTESGGEWTGRVNLVEGRLGLPLSWQRPRKIFVNAQSDLFHDGVPDEYIARVWAVMALADRHTFQVLTKRPGRMRSLLSSEDFEAAVFDACEGEFQGYFGLPLPNVWLGVSAEVQRWADVRVPALLGTPAAVRFISAEPLLGAIDLLGDEENPGPAIMRTGWHNPGGPWGPDEYGYDDQVGIDWVIVGGESGPGARPMEPDWARSLRDQCQQAGIAYLFKQWGEHAPRCTLALCGTPCTCDGRNHSHPTEMRRVGKKAAGRELDGRTWDEFPEPRRLEITQ